MGMYDVKTETYVPDNSMLDGFPIEREVLKVAEGKNVMEHEIVMLSSGEAEPLQAEITKNATPAVYTITLAKSYAAGDTITLNNITYTAVNADPVAANHEFLVGEATAVAGSIDDAIVLEEVDFDVTVSGNEISFTQKTAGIGNLPILSSSVDSGCSVEITAPYAPAVASLTNSVAEKIYGIAVNSATSSELVTVNLTGDYMASELVLPQGITAADVKLALRRLSIFLK